MTLVVHHILRDMTLARYCKKHDKVGHSQEAIEAYHHLHQQGYPVREALSLLMVVEMELSMRLVK
ncbi:hypothetical protein D3C78_1889150 [compost metagenome]